MQDTVDYNLVLRKAYQVSMHYIHENDMAKDIAQATAIKYYLNVAVCVKKDVPQFDLFFCSKKQTQFCSSF